MAYGSVLDRPVQLRHDDGEAELVFSDQDLSDSDQSHESESAESESQSEKEDAADPSSSEEEDVDLNNISFGALAKAQETFKPKERKRKLGEALEEAGTNKEKVNEENTFSTRRRAKEPRIDAPKRTSKHAPAVESARKPVSRKRTIFEPPPAEKFRDPRFDPAVMSANRDRNAVEKANKNYSFLTTYQAAEILELKNQIKKTKDPEVVADLKRQVMSIESKLRNAEARQRENEIRRKHKQQEKEALRTGQKAKPYYLKEADVKKLAKQERLESMSKRAREKAEKRRQKREKGKDAKDMPRVRREG
ncbi:rRNA biogenesis protein rrp36 [Exophiala dermatitidis]